MFPSYTQQAKEHGKEIQKILGRELTIDELWAFVKLFKVVRRSCRSNIPFNNAMEAAFPYSRFSQTGREYKPGKRGLVISIREETRTDDSDTDE